MRMQILIGLFSTDCLFNFLFNLIILVGQIMTIRTFSFLFLFALLPLATQCLANPNIDTQVKTLKAQAQNIDTKVLRLGLVAYKNAKAQGIAKKDLLTVIDYSKPSTAKRLWVFDLKNSKTLYNTWVTHGKNSGNNRATSFSNRSGSLKSSIGLFVTDRTYFGKLGYSLKIRGLERGFNSNAYDRAIVVHGASYANADIIRRYGRLGRSWGCPAVSHRLARPIINTIKNKSIIFAYYPDRRWLAHSQYLKQA